MDNKFKYDVALSFAGEDRKYVEEVAYYLKSKKVKVFYDYFERVNLWGKDLVENLEKIYSYEARYCVIFISAYYVKKDWTCYECAVAAQRMLQNRTKRLEYILPVKFDDTKVPGILDTVGYIDAIEFSPADVGEMIEKKVLGESEEHNAFSVSFLFNKLKEGIYKSFEHTYIKNTITESLDYVELSFFKFDVQFYKIIIRVILNTDFDIILEVYEYFKEAAYYTDLPGAIINIEVSSGAVLIKNFGFFDCNTLNMSFDNLVDQINHIIVKNVEG